MLSLIKALIPVYHSICFCLLRPVNKEVVGQVPSSGTWDKGERPRCRKRPGGWAEWTALGSGLAEKGGCEVGLWVFTGSIHSSLHSLVLYTQWLPSGVCTMSSISQQFLLSAHCAKHCSSHRNTVGTPPGSDCTWRSDPSGRS